MMEQVTHRRFIAHSDAHYAGGIVDGGYLMRMFGEIATDISLLISHDEGLLAGYEQVTFTAPIFAGDVIESTGTIIGVGNRSRRIAFVTRIVSPGASGLHGSLKRAPRTIAAKAIGTLVIPKSATEPALQN